MPFLERILKISSFLFFSLWVSHSTTLASDKENDKVGDKKKELESNMVEIEGTTQGTTFHIKYLDDAALNFQKSRDERQQAINEILNSIDLDFSTYSGTSKVSLFNGDKAYAWVKVTPQFYELYKISRDISQKTFGAFDPTVGKLVDLWGFGTRGKVSEAPSDEMLRQLVGNLGIRNLEHIDKDFAIRKLNDDVSLDFSAIAPGYSVDKIAVYFDSTGISNYLIEVGGEMRASGLKGPSKDWQVAIERPTPLRQQIQLVLKIRNKSLATSGDYRNYYELNGVRISHIIDPNSGRPLNHNTASVSIVMPTCAEADAMATAMYVMGKDKGLAFSEQFGIASFFIVRNKDKFEEYYSSEFLKLLEGNKPKGS